MVVRVGELLSVRRGTINILSNDHRVSVRGISVSFAGVTALTDVSIDFEPGEIHALVGENGAGKSTLGKVVGGAIKPDSGYVSIDGHAAHFRTPFDALQRGISMVAQEIALAGHLTVIENVYLGLERNFWTSRRKMLEQLKELMEWSDIRVDPHSKVADLSLAEQQKVEILRSLARDSRLIIFDEPTAALGLQETRSLLATMRTLKDRGRTAIFVTHYLEEVLQVSDRVSVLRDGALVGTFATSEMTKSSLVEKMIGQRSGLQFPPKAPVKETRDVISVQNLRAPNVQNVSLNVREGQIVALTGLVGSGRTEVLNAIFTGEFDGGAIVIGKNGRSRSVSKSIRQGLAYIPESRKDQGLLLSRSIRENISLAHMGSISGFGWIRKRKEVSNAKRLINELRIRCSSIDSNVENLSGGNQQKVMFAKWLFRPPRLLIIDEPTRGVDVGAKSAIYSIIQSLAADGMAVLMVSSEFEEVVGLAHVAYVMYRGRIVGKLNSNEMDEDKLLRLSFMEEEYNEDREELRK